MKRHLLVVVALLCASCTTRLHYDYFEPSGLDSVISTVPEAPKSVATLSRAGCKLWIVAVVSTENLIVVSIRAFVPPGTQVAFSGRKAKLEVAGSEEMMNLSWLEWTLSDGVGARHEVAFDAPLKPQSFARTPTRKGVEDMGSYEATLTLPRQYSNTREFSLSLPSPGAYPPLHMRFVRKTANYRVFVQLQ
jgi:hypothetical protein